MYMQLICLTLFPFSPRFDHFANLHDSQTLAMLSCVFTMHKTQWTTEQHNNDHNSHSTNNSKAPGEGGVEGAGGGVSPTKRLQGQSQAASGGERYSMSDRYTMSDRFAASERLGASEKFSVIERVMGGVGVTTSLPTLSGSLAVNGGGGNALEGVDVTEKEDLAIEQQTHEANCKWVQLTQCLLLHYYRQVRSAQSAGSLWFSSWRFSLFIRMVHVQS